MAREAAACPASVCVGHSTGIIFHHLSLIHNNTARACTHTPKTHTKQTAPPTTNRMLKRHLAPHAYVLGWRLPSGVRGEQVMAQVWSNCCADVTNTNGCLSAKKLIWPNFRDAQLTTDLWPTRILWHGGGEESSLFVRIE